MVASSLNGQIISEISQERLPVSNIIMLHILLIKLGCLRHTDIIELKINIHLVILEFPGVQDLANNCLVYVPMYNCDSIINCKFHPFLDHLILNLYATCSFKHKCMMMAKTTYQDDLFDEYFLPLTQLRKDGDHLRCLTIPKLVDLC